MAGARRTRTRRANVELDETSFLPAILANLNKLSKKEVHIGMQGNADLAMIAGVHEYGSAKMKIPARSFIGTGKKKSSAGISKWVRTNITPVAMGNMDVMAFLEEIGVIGETKTLANFNRIKQPPLSPLYARRKKGKKILIAEAELRDSITHVIVDK
ncbi:hypothetical protein [Paenibacillus polymyxa]|uniref:Uncharacterized protein n=1 Tax=Paenibacillus polymyxa TaxID=1406 RepID=A0AAP4ECP8_PAEPO|nr:hypothetical protein [Paenibacillus polymyxa]MDH2334280.1 hypothetical protein [Paenibacillus polymyxa]